MLDNVDMQEVVKGKKKEKIDNGNIEISFLKSIQPSLEKWVIYINGHMHQSGRFNSVFYGCYESQMAWTFLAKCHKIIAFLIF